MTHSPSNPIGKRVVWITGAGRGIGAALARRLAAEGCLLALSGRNETALTALAAELSSQFAEQGCRASAFVCDVSERASVEAASGAIAEQFGSIDILVNNAGIAVFAGLESFSHEDFERTIAVNLAGPFCCIKAALPAMLEKSAGVIVNINSIAATTTFVGASVYAASKAGLLAMSRSLRQEVRSRGVKVIDVLPGATETDIWDASARAEFSARMMQPDDVAEAVVSALRLNPRVMPEEIVLRPQGGDL